MPQIETIKVTRIGSNKQTIINKDDFDPKLHTLPGKAEKKVAKKKASKKTKG